MLDRFKIGKQKINKNKNNETQAKEKIIFFYCKFKEAKKVSNLQN